ncbi:ABC transporter permease [Clostridioides difficile]|uniref:ABC transporter permease n=2 Tax=Clostridioides difficile TaxID=1496 RepID=A0AAX3H4E6_CLODI|nr:ABC transporter permease subunit [Clostridioides difficile]AVD36353.1 ABC transporter permease [Clostridioides difficile]AVD40195.1 ABC transporter permease [Clostridioides difficile]AVD43708.1 ABC transporter permease [Clostridioides difficile]AXU66738.1 ABC transporter permease [Clostridioides difficile]AXU88951.1 ABC transporter permease [Clostridioides difficile]
MREYIAFTKKEFKENLRNYKLFSLIILFLVFGIMSPLSAKFMPDLIAHFAPTLKVTTAPTALDSWTQFSGNISGLGASLTLIVFCNILSNEYSKGTLVIMLTKGLSRSSVILSKFSIAVIIMTIGFWLSFLCTYGYTMYFWPTENLNHIIFSAFNLWLINIMYITILILGCVLFRPAFASVLLVLVATLILSLISIPKQIAPYTPNFILSKNIDLVSGKVAAPEFIIPMIVTIVISIICLLLAVILFKKKAV